MQDREKCLPLPDEPVELRDRTRTTLEDSPETGSRIIDDAAFIADFLWREWGEDLEGADMDYDRFLAIARGYTGESRLWVVGERPWDHFAAGFAGRVWRRLGVRGEQATDERVFATMTGGSR